MRILIAVFAAVLFWGCVEQTGGKPEDAAQAKRICADAEIEGVSGYEGFMRANNVRWLTVYCGPANTMLWELADGQ